MKRLEDRYEVKMYTYFDYSQITIMKREFRTRDEAAEAFQRAKELIEFFKKITLPPRPKNPRIITLDEIGTIESRDYLDHYD